MPSKKPIAAPRAPGGTKKKLALPEPREALNRALERIGRAHERPNAEPEPEPGGRGVVERVGRGKERKGAGKLRRMTVYLPIAVADEVEERARKRRTTFSIVTSETLADAYGIALEQGAAE